MQFFSTKALSELPDHAENQRWVRQVNGFALFVGLMPALKQQRKALGLDVLVPPSPGVWRQGRESCSPIDSVGKNIQP